jgi:hypothetical protein
MNTVRLAGRVLQSDGSPVAHAQLRFVSDLATLGAAANASVSMRTASTWTRQVTGLNGNRWNVYSQYVANKVAGMTFAEFKQCVVDKNPALKTTGYVFVPQSRYLLPENVVDAVEVRWDRDLAGFEGNRWQCWRTYVAGKVVGVSWSLFKDAVTQENPALAGDGYMFRAEKHYKLPRNPHLPEYEIATTTTARGSYVVEQLPIGDYRVEVVVNGQLCGTQMLHVTATSSQNIVLSPPQMLALAADDFVRVDGTDFILSTAPFKRFVGVNITGILHYGETYIDEGGHTQLIVAHSTTAHRRQALQEAREIGAKVVRVFLPHYSCPNEKVAERLDAVLTELRAVSSEMYLIPVFIDLYHNRGFFPHPKAEVDDGFYAEQGSMRRLRPKFFVPPYCPQYLSLVDHIVMNFRGEKRILAWEIGNELKLDPVPPPGIGKQDFVSFNHFVAERIKSIDPNHLVTTGMKSTQHPHLLHDRDLAERLYNGRRANGTRLIDFITIHSYFDPNEAADETLGFALDAKLAKALGMPIIVEETGVSKKADDCRTRLSEHMKRWLDIDSASDELAARGMLEWGFCPQGVGDGSNDNCNDRAIIKEVYSGRSQMLAV